MSMSIDVFELIFDGIIIKPHIIKYIDSLTVVDWTRKSHSQIIEEASHGIWNPNKKTPEIDIQSVLIEVGATDYLSTLPYLNFLQYYSAGPTMSISIKFYIIHKISIYMLDNIKTEHNKWFNLNKDKYATIIQKYMRKNEAMWKYPLFALRL